MREGRWMLYSICKSRDVREGWVYSEICMVRVLVYIGDRVREVSKGRIREVVRCFV